MIIVKHNEYNTLYVILTRKILYSSGFFFFFHFYHNRKMGCYGFWCTHVYTYIGIYLVAF